MRAKSVRQLLDSAAHVEEWRDGIGWIAVSRDRVILFCYYKLATSVKHINNQFRIVTVKGKAIA